MNSLRTQISLLTLTHDTSNERHAFPPFSQHVGSDMSSWFYLSAGKKHGPIDSIELRKLARTGKVLPTDSIWKEGLPDWIEAADIEGLFTLAPTDIHTLNDTEEPADEDEEPESSVLVKTRSPKSKQRANIIFSGVAPRNIPTYHNRGQLIIAASIVLSSLMVLAYFVVADAKRKSEIHAAATASWRGFLRRAEGRAPLVVEKYLREVGGDSKADCRIQWGTCSLVDSEPGQVGRAVVSIYKKLPPTIDFSTTYWLDFTLAGDDWIFTKGEVTHYSSDFKNSRDTECRALEGDIYLLFAEN